MKRTQPENMYQCSIPLKIKDKVAKFKMNVNSVKFRKCENCSFEAPTELSLLSHSCDTNHLIFDENNRVLGSFKVLSTQETYTDTGHSRQVAPKSTRERTKYSDNRIPCEFCNHIAQDTSALKLHTLRKHVSEAVKRKTWFHCEYCDYRSAAKDAVVRHTFVRHSTKEDVEWMHCDLCDYKSKVKENFRKHTMKRHLQNGPLPIKIKIKCHFCDLWLRQLSLKGHIALKHVEAAQGCTCNICKGLHLGRKRKKDVSTDGNKWLKRQRYDYNRLNILETQNNKTRKLYNCEHCDYNTFDRTTMARHTFTRHSFTEDTILLNCDTCDYKTRAKEDLEKHIEHEHQKIDEPKKMYKCSIPLKLKFKVAKFDHKADVPVDSLKFKKCEYCLFQGISQIMFLKHSCNPKLTMVDCTECDRVFATIPLLNEHMKMVHSENKRTFKCKLCNNFETGVKKSLENHMIRKHITEEEKQKTWFYCDHCEYRCADKSAIKKHIFVRHSSKENIDWLKCEFCDDYKTKVKDNLKKHLIKRHPAEHNRICIEKSRRSLQKVTQLDCKHCTRVFTSLITLNRHIRVSHPNVKQWFHCEHCNFKTLFRAGIRVHKRRKHITEEEKQKTWFKCDYCEYRSAVRDAVAKHTFVRHSKKENIDWLHCEFCDNYRTKVKDNLQKHILKRHPVEYNSNRTEKSRRVSCKDCNRIFSSSITLKRHTRVSHSKVKQWYHCEHCNFKTLFRDGIIVHMRRKHISEEEKQKTWFKCDYCEYRSAVKDDIAKHTFVRHSTKENIDWLNCGLCDNYRTKVKENLKKHILKRHSTENNSNPEKSEGFNCKDCNRVFPSLFKLRNHEKSGHLKPREWFKCEFCEHKTLFKADLYVHKRRKHISEEEKQKTWFHCKYCEYRSAVKEAVDKHTISKHSSKENFEWLYCDYCDYKTQIRSNLQKHISTRHKYGIVQVTARKDDKPQQNEEVNVEEKVAGPKDEVVELIIIDSEDEEPNKSEIEANIEERATQQSEEVNTEEKIAQPKEQDLEPIVIESDDDEPHQIQKDINVDKTTPPTDSQQWYKCQHCDYQAPRRYVLERHTFIRHTPKEDVDWIHCDYCDYKTKVKDNLRKHLDIHRKNGLIIPKTVIECRFCKEVFRNKSELKRHLKEKHITKKYIKGKRMHKCTQCDYHYEFKSAIDRHIFLKHSSKEHLDWIHCEDCDYKTKVKDNLRKHKVAQHPPKEVILPPLVKVQSDVGEFWVNQSSVKSPVVTIDEKDHDLGSSKVQDNLQKLVETTRKEQILPPPEKVQPSISEVWINKSSVKSPIVTVHGINHKPEQRLPYDLGSSKVKDNLRKLAGVQILSPPEKIPSNTGGSLPSNSSVKSDIVTVHGAEQKSEQQITCDVCEQVIHGISNFRLHVLNKHSKDDPMEIKWLKCAFCDYATLHQEGLDKHMSQKHLLKDEFQEFYKCEHCDYQTTVKHHFRLHVFLRHDGQL